MGVAAGEHPGSHQLADGGVKEALLAVVNVALTIDPDAIVCGAFDVTEVGTEELSGQFGMEVSGGFLGCGASTGVSGHLRHSNCLCIPKLGAPRQEIEVWFPWLPGPI